MAITESFPSNNSGILKKSLIKNNVNPPASNSVDLTSPFDKSVSEPIFTFNATSSAKKWKELSSYQTKVRNVNYRHKKTIKKYLKSDDLMQEVLKSCLGKHKLSPMKPATLVDVNEGDNRMNKKAKISVDTPYNTLAVAEFQPCTSSWKHYVETCVSWEVPARSETKYSFICLKDIWFLFL